MYDLKIIYLYVKTHSKTGIKYLGKTTRNPFTYSGSGADWKAHLKLYGSDHTTEIIRECKTKEELSKWGRYYSELWQVAKSAAWANRIPETGGGWCSEPARKKISEKLRGRKKPPRTREHTEKIAAQMRGKPNPKTALGLEKWYASNPDRSEAIKKQAKSLKDWYLNNSDLAHNKALRSWDEIYRKNYDKYKMAVVFIAEGKTNMEIIKLMKIDYATVKKLRLKTHRILRLFPELEQLMGP